MLVSGIKVKNKIINYNNNFIELINMESGLRVFPDNDELLDMIYAGKLQDSKTVSAILAYAVKIRH